MASSTAQQTITLPEGVTYQGRRKVTAPEYWLHLILQALNISQEDLPLETGLVFQGPKGKKHTLVNQYRVEHKKFSRAKLFIHYSPHLLPQSEHGREIFLGRLDSLGCLTKYSESLSPQEESLLTLHILLGYRGSRSYRASNIDDLLNEGVKRKLSREFEEGIRKRNSSLSPSSSSLSPSLSYLEALKEIPNLPSNLQEEINAMLEVNTLDREDNRPLTFPEEEILDAIRDGLNPLPVQPND